MGETVNGKSSEVSGIFSTDSLVNLEYFDTDLMGAADCGYMILTQKLPQKLILRGLKLRGLKLRGLRRNQISTPHFIYKNDQYNKINTG